MLSKSNLHAKASPSFPDSPSLVQTNQYFMKTFPGSWGEAGAAGMALCGGKKEPGPVCGRFLLKGPGSSSSGETLLPPSPAASWQEQGASFPLTSPSVRQPGRLAHDSCVVRTCWRYERGRERLPPQSQQHVVQAVLMVLPVRTPRVQEHSGLGLWWLTGHRRPRPRSRGPGELAHRHEAPPLPAPSGACLTHCRPPGSSPGPMGMGANRVPAAVATLASCWSLSAPLKLWDQPHPPDPRNK